MIRRRIHSFALALLATAWAFSTPSGAAPGAAGATRGSAALPASLDLPDEALFAQVLAPDLTVQLLDSRFVGIALRAPGRVDIDKRSSLPLLVASRFDGARGWALPFDGLAQLVAIELQTGQLRVQPAFGSDKRSAPAGRGARPSPDDMRQFGAQLTWVDARSRLAIPWQPGCWALRLVYHDWVSNPVHVLLESGQQRSAAACRPASSAGAQIDFRLVRAAANMTMRVSGQFTLPAEALGADRTALAASVLVVTPNGAALERTDWRIPIAPVPGARSISGVFDQEWAAQLTPGALAYLIVAGQVLGPRTWESATTRAR